MKKLLILSNCILFSIILFMACNGGPGQDMDKKKVRSDVTGPRPEVLDQVLDTMFEKEGGILDARLAIKMSQDYNNDISKGYIKGMAGLEGGEDATSIWFKLSTLRSFIEKAEKALAGGPYAEGMGVRIYYAKYPADLSPYPSLAGLSRSVANRHTVFLVPTYRNRTTAEDVDFNYDFIKDPNNPLSFNKLLLQDPNARMNGILGFVRPVIRSGGGVIPNIQNHGGLRPPPAGEDEVFPIGE